MNGWLSRTEQAVFGAAAEICPVTGMVYENGIGAPSKEAQTAAFVKRLSGDAQWIPRHVVETLYPELAKK
jgi:hypothetical protein